MEKIANCVIRCFKMTLKIKTFNANYSLVEMYDTQDIGKQ